MAIARKVGCGCLASLGPLSFDLRFAVFWLASSRASSLPQWIEPNHALSARHRTGVGASLLAKKSPRFQRSGAINWQSLAVALIIWPLGRSRPLSVTNSNFSCFTAATRGQVFHAFSCALSLARITSGSLCNTASMLTCGAGKARSLNTFRAPHTSSASLMICPPPTVYSGLSHT